MTFHENVLPHTHSIFAHVRLLTERVSRLLCLAILLSVCDFLLGWRRPSPWGGKELTWMVEAQPRFLGGEVLLCVVPCLAGGGPICWEARTSLGWRRPSSLAGEAATHTSDKTLVPIA